MATFSLSEDEVREAVIAEALTWFGTKFHHAQCAKGAGVDCAMLNCAVFSAVGVVPWVDPRPYPADWHIHNARPLMREIISEYATEISIEEAKPADIFLYRWGRVESHMAIVENDEFIIHAYAPAGKVGRLERTTLEHRLTSAWSVFA